MADRQYDDREVGAILRAAAEMRSETTKPTSQGGMTLVELQKVAGELGIDPADIGRAARELDASPRGRWKGRPRSILLERSFEGELSDDAWDELVTESRRFSGRSGTIETKEGSREWSGGSELGTVMLSATTRNGRTRLSLLGETGGFAAMAWTLGLTVALLASTIPLVVSKTHSPMAPLLTLALTVAIVCLCALATAMVVRTQRGRSASQMESFWERISEIAQADTGQGTLGVYALGENIGETKPLEQVLHP